VIPHRQGHEYFHSAQLLFLSPQAHSNSRHKEEENPGHKAEETAHVGLAKDEPLIGVIALESIGLTVDPLKKRLKKTRHLLCNL